MSNPYPRNRTKTEFNRKKPSQKMKPFLYFYEFAKRTPLTHEKNV